MKLNTLSFVKFGLTIALLLIVLVGCNKSIEQSDLQSNQEVQEKTEIEKLEAENTEKENREEDKIAKHLEEDGKLAKEKKGTEALITSPSTQSSESTSIFNNLIDSWSKLWDKAKSVGNPLSKLDSDVRKVKKMEFTDDELTFTLEDLFKGTLDNPIWKSKEVNGFNVVMVSGGVSQLMKDLDNTESSFGQALNQLAQKSIEMTVILPIHKGEIVVASIGCYVEAPGIGMIPMAGPEIMIELKKMYLSEHAKK